MGGNAWWRGWVPYGIGEDMLRGTIRLATCRPNGFGPPHCHRRRTIVDPVTQSQNSGRPNRASWIFPCFLPRGRSHRLGTIGGNGSLFGRSRRKLWVEMPGGGDGSRRGSVRTCFMRR